MQYPGYEWYLGNNWPAHEPSGEVGRSSAELKRTDSTARMWGVSLQESRPLCSKCHGEPRYPGQRWGPRCFARYHANRRARRRCDCAAGSVRDRATTYINRQAYNTPRPLFEQLKRVILEVPKYRNRPETIRISLLPYKGYVYVDVRVYLKGKPTRKGITIHSDLVPAVIEGMQRALRTPWDALSRPSEPGPAQGQTGISWPAGLW